MTLLLTWLLGFGLMGALVVLHHEGLAFLRRRWFERTAKAHRDRMVLAVLALLALHVVEAIIYGLGMMAADRLVGAGMLETPGAARATAADYLYFSTSTYTSLGLGDLVPTGHMRLLAGLEALLGLILIGWSASFLFVEVRTATDAPR